MEMGGEMRKVFATVVMALTLAGLLCACGTGEAGQPDLPEQEVVENIPDDTEAAAEDKPDAAVPSDEKAAAGDDVNLPQEDVPPEEQEEPVQEPAKEEPVQEPVKEEPVPEQPAQSGEEAVTDAVPEAEPEKVSYAGPLALGAKVLIDAEGFGSSRQQVP